MSTRRCNNMLHRHGVRHWRLGPHGPAAAAAANGDPGLLLALDASDLHDHRARASADPPVRGDHR